MLPSPINQRKRINSPIKNLNKTIQKYLSLAQQSARVQSKQTFRTIGVFLMHSTSAAGPLGNSRSRAASAPRRIVVGAARWRHGLPTARLCNAALSDRTQRCHIEPPARLYSTYKWISTKRFVKKCFKTTKVVKLIHLYSMFIQIEGSGYM